MPAENFADGIWSGAVMRGDGDVPSKTMRICRKYIKIIYAYGFEGWKIPFFLLQQ